MPSSDDMDHARENCLQRSMPKGNSKQSHGIKKNRRHQPTRQSSRLRTGASLQQIVAESAQPGRVLLSPSTSNRLSSELPKSPANSPPQEAEQRCSQQQELGRKRRRSPNAQDPSPRAVQHEVIEKRRRVSPALATGEKGVGDSPASRQEAEHRSAQHREGNRTGGQASPASYVVERNEVAEASRAKDHPIQHWIQEGSWPKEYFRRGVSMTLPLAQLKSAAVLRREALESSSVTTSQSQTSGGKSAPYRDLAYATLLAEIGRSFLAEDSQGIADHSKHEYRTLLETEQAYPPDSLFRDDLFKETCTQLTGRNEARVINDIGRLIVPSAETLATYGAIHLKHLVVGINERWNESIPITATSPQPDFCVGFRRSAFTPDQLKRIEPATGYVLAAKKSRSYFLATWMMYFPFFACEAKCGSGGLDVADRQNAHSMTLAVRGIVELFKAVKRQSEVHRRILAFSISHDDEAVRIYGHYPVLDDAGGETAFYRHSVKKFSFTDDNGKEKWTAYRFTKNLYDLWMPTHHQLICSAIADLPPNPDVAISASEASAPIAGTEDDSEQRSERQELATSARSSQDSAVFKKPRLPPKVMLQQDNDRQREQIDELRAKLEQEREQRERETERQRLEMKQESERQRQEMKQESERQRQEMKEAVDQLREQNRELMNLLKQR